MVSITTAIFVTGFDFVQGSVSGRKMVIIRIKTGNYKEFVAHLYGKSR
jgi:hypothetical protein